MRWEEYREIYENYELPVNQTSLLSIAAREVLRDFPERLPKEMVGPLRHMLADIQESLAEYLAIVEVTAPSEQPKPFYMQIEIEDSRASHEVIRPFASMFLACVHLGMIYDEVDFERLVCSQELVMLFAHFDAFLSDSLDAVCRARPEVMKSRKQMDWESILSCVGWEELIDHMIDQYVFQFGHEPVSKRIEFLRDRIGLTIECQDNQLHLISEAENIRHMVVHNGGRVNEDFIKKVQHCALSPGDFVPVTPEYVSSVSEATRFLAAPIFAGISTKFFGKSDSDIEGIWRGRSTRPPKLESNA